MEIDKLKPCDRCGGNELRVVGHDPFPKVVSCACGHGGLYKVWNNRPLEDDLQRQLDVAKRALCDIGEVYADKALEGTASGGYLVGVIERIAAITQEVLKTGDRKTQENLRAPNYQEYQKEIEIEGHKVWADPELIPLLKSLNEVGLITRSHCCGHGKNPAWVVIRMESILNLEVRNNGSYRELLLTWNMKT